MLGKIHSHSARRPELAAEFDTDTIFFDIRLEPYLLATARRHPDLASRLEHLVDVTRSHRVALVHGDVSPKNILIGANGPVFLDAECAWWGDPAFDIAFCLNHLLLKCLWTPGCDAGIPRFVRRAGRGVPACRWTGSRRTHWSSARLPCCRASFSRGSTASPRSSTSPKKGSASGCGAWPVSC